MKTRIISGAVMIALLIAVLFGGSYYPVIITVFLALLNIIASYELLCNAAGIKSKVSLAGAAVYSAAAVFLISGYGEKIFSGAFGFKELSVIYCVFAAIMSLVNHSRYGVKEIAMTVGMPIVLSFAFGSLEGILNHSHGIYYLLLLLNFSSICDMGAYFVGSTCGKHKLCPAISPKKSVEGAFGGVVSSLVITAVLALCFGTASKLPALLLLTVPFCILGMVGDLFASAIKRGAGIKDYGKLIPGHGGVLDRVDSILMIAPVLYMFINAGAM